MTYTELLSGIAQANLTEDQLLTLSKALCIQLKVVRSKKANIARRQLRVGDRVSYTDQYGLTKATVIKINRTRAICNTEYGQSRSVPLSMLAVV